MNNNVLELLQTSGSDLDLEPLMDEKPSRYAERLGIIYSSKVTAEHKKESGQYFTNILIADFMSKLSMVNKHKIKILDPGCGTAILSCSITEYLAENKDKVKEVGITLYETDPEILPFLQKSLIYLTEWLNKKQIKLKFDLITKDFILENHSALENSELKLFDGNRKLFDIIISNPPYFKIAKSDIRAEFSKSIIHGQPNIYSIFFAISANLLDKDGELIFIMPRSFTSGYYFRLFREKIFSIIQPTKIHIFISRKEAFDRDKVLQENIIVKAKRISDLSENKIKVSASHGLKDIDEISEKEYELNDLIDLKSHHKILYIPSSEKEEKTIKLFKSWEGSLHLYNIQISTGPVVPFRCNEFICETENNENNLAPLFWLHNIAKMTVKYPFSKPNKGKYIKICNESLPLLIKNKNYIIMRRFSSKDDKSRLVVTPYFSDFSDSAFIGIENHLNYIYRPNGDLGKEEILGLSALLNSTLFDTYFQTFSGNTQVSATELREMPLPSLDKIISIGRYIEKNQDFTQDTIDRILNNILEINEQN
jgi:adenine-specific DNA-methyltransferase